MTKEFRFLFAHDSETKRKLAEIANGAGISQSEVIRNLIDFAHETMSDKVKIPVIGTISGENNKITITQLDGEVMTVEEELARR